MVRHFDEIKETRLTFYIRLSTIIASFLMRIVKIIVVQELIREVFGEMTRKCVFLPSRRYLELVDQNMA